MKSETIILGGRTYQITERPTRANKAWRDQLTAVLEPVAGIVEQVTGGALSLPESVEEMRAKPQLLTDLGGVVKRLTGLLLEGLDNVLDLTLDYSPALKADREWIEGNAYDSEILAAFTAVLGLAYPLGGVIHQLVKIGSPTPATSPNFAGQNGAVGMTN